MTFKLQGGNVKLRYFRDMIVMRWTAGKTPPRLLEDLNLYNPDRLPSTQYNVLADLSLPFDGKSALPRKTGKGSCRHRWQLKAGSCSPFLIDTESNPAQHVVAAICSLCRCHVRLVIDTRGEGEGVMPCPNVVNPLHHFLYIPEQSSGLKRTTIKTTLDSWEDIRVFQCSTMKCAARLAIHMQSPRLVKDWVELLTDKATITKRAEAAMASDPKKFEGHAPPTAITIIGYLRMYISNAMKGDHRRILASNKKWMLSFGESCREFLEYLQFTFNVRVVL